MSFNYYHNTSIVGTDKSLQRNRGKFDVKANMYAGDLINVGDKVVFTSCHFHGSVGPSQAATTKFYENYYSQGILDLFGTQHINGVQNFKIPNDGTYRFTVMGGFAGHNIDQLGGLQSPISGWDTNLTLTSDFPTSNNSGQITFSTGTTLAYQYGCPGQLVADEFIAKDTELNIIVGHAGGSAIYVSGGVWSYTVAASGGGASCVFISPNGTGSLDSGSTSEFVKFDDARYIVSGGAGPKRNKDNSNNSNQNSAYQTTGKTGSNSSGGSNGYAATSHSNGAGGAGLLGNAGGHGDLRSVYLRPYARSTGSWNNQPGSRALIYGGKGQMSAAGYQNPYYSGAEGAYYRGFYVDSNGEVTAAGFKVVTTFSGAGGSNNSTYYNNYLAYYHGKNDPNGSATLTDTWVPSWAGSGGFGGGSPGNWGGSGGGGGYSGGGGGGNIGGGYAGAGSSYHNLTTHSMFTTMNKSNTSNSITSPISPVGTFVLNQNVPLGVWKGNGFVVIERTA